MGRAGVPLKAIKWMFQEHAPLSIRPDGTLFQLQWMWQMLLNCSAGRYAVNKERMVRLAEYSRDCIRALRAETGIAYEGRQQGTLQVFRTEAQLQGAAKDIAVLEEAGVPYQLLSREELAASEPALAAVRHKLAGGLRSPMTNPVTARCSPTGWQPWQSCWRPVPVQPFDRQPDDPGRCRHRAWSMASRWRRPGGGSAGQLVDALVKPFLRGMSNLPVYPLKGFSITVPLSDASRSPVSTVLDETYKVAITRFDDRIRVGGMAQIVGYDRSLDPAKRRTLEHVLTDLFPRRRRCQPRRLLDRPAPDDAGRHTHRRPTQVRGLWLNTGHGTLGWTMACGSGKLLSDLVSGKSPAIRADDLSAGRYLKPSRQHLAPRPAAA